MHILLVEDDQELRASIARGLHEASYTVDQAATGPEALAQLGGHAYDLVILDVLLPEKTGITVCRAVRERGNNVPILMLTALDEVEQRIAGLDAGADDYMTKPFDFGELLARVRALTRRRGEVVAPIVTVGDLTIDAGRHSVRRGTREISLTATEFTFLLHLARNHGHVVSRAELVRHVWGDAGSTYSNIIDVYASRLRRKIDEGEEDALLTTVRGIGFMLDAPAEPTARRAGHRR